MSQYTLEVIASWRDFAGTDAPDLIWRPNGYLFIGAGTAVLQASLAAQLAHGCAARVAPGKVDNRSMLVNPTFVCMGDLWLFGIQVASW